MIDLPKVENVNNLNSGDIVLMSGSDPNPIDDCIVLLRVTSKFVILEFEGHEGKEYAHDDEHINRMTESGQWRMFLISKRGAFRRILKEKND